MKKSLTKVATVMGLTLTAALVATGCSVVRDQQSVGSYIDDVTISNMIRAKFVESKIVSLNAIDVETLKGVVQLSGFAKSQMEKDRAEQIVRGTDGVKGIRNDIIVRP